MQDTDSTSSHHEVCDGKTDPGFVSIDGTVILPPPKPLAISELSEEPSHMGSSRTAEGRVPRIKLPQLDVVSVDTGEDVEWNGKMRHVGVQAEECLIHCSTGAATEENVPAIPAGKRPMGKTCYNLTEEPKKKLPLRHNITEKGADWCELRLEFLSKKIDQPEPKHVDVPLFTIRADAGEIGGEDEDSDLEECSDDERYIRMHAPEEQKEKNYDETMIS